jgi:hypothetical protein
METLCSSETLVTIDQPAMCNISENWSLIQYGGMWSCCISYNCCPYNLNFQGEVERDFIVHLLRGSHAHRLMYIGPCIIVIVNEMKNQLDAT